MDDTKPVLLVSSNWVDLIKTTRKYSDQKTQKTQQSEFGGNYEGSEGSAIVTVVCEDSGGSASKH